MYLDLHPKASNYLLFLTWFVIYKLFKKESWKCDCDEWIEIMLIRVRWRVNSVLKKGNRSILTTSNNVLHVIVSQAACFIAYKKPILMCSCCSSLSPFGTFQKLSGPLDQLLTFSQTILSLPSFQHPRSLMGNGDVIWCLLLVTYNGNFLSQQLCSLGASWALCCHRCALLLS